MSKIDINDLYAFAHKSVLDGLVIGEAIAKNISYILQHCADYGANEALTKSYFPASVDIENFADLNRECTGIFVEGLFDGKGLKNAINTIVLMGAAFGFQQKKAKLAVNSNPSDAANS